jgi:parvulin-like peptidyl-prolyl isomerase
MLIMAQRSRIRQEDLAEAARQLAQPAFQSLIRKALLLGAVEEQAIQIDPAAVQERIDAMQAQVPEGQTWEAILEARGLQEDQVREQIAASLRIEQLVRDRTADLEPVPPEEIEAFYASRTEDFVQPELAGFSHILFKLNAEATEEEVAEVEARAEKLKAMIGDQLEFEPLAARFSEDENTKTKGGYVGKVPKGRLPPTLDEALFGTPTGEVTLARSPEGLHLIRVETLEPERPLTLEEVTPAVSNLLVRQRGQEKLETYLQELQEKAEIEIIGPLPAGVEP